MAILDLQDALELIEAGRADEAIPVLTTWTQQMPTHAAVHVVLARAHETVEQWQEAEAAWKGARFLMPNSPAIAEGLSRARKAALQAVPAEAERLMMDLDLQAELEASLEALFNPFTLPQQAEAPPAEPAEPTPPADPTQTQVKAALAAASRNDDAVQAIIDEFEATEVVEAPAEVPEAPAKPEDAEVEVEDAEVGEETPATTEAEALRAAQQALAQAEAADAAPEAATETETAPAIPVDPYASGITSIYDVIDQAIEEKEQEKLDTSPKTETPATQEEPPTDDAAATTASGAQPEAIEDLETRLDKASAYEAGGIVEDWEEFIQESEHGASAQHKDDEIDPIMNALGSRLGPITMPSDIDEVEPPNLEDDTEGMVSETLAGIYASQNLYRKAALAYEQLALENPDKAERFNQLADKMNALADDDDNE